MQPLIRLGCVGILITFPLSAGAACPERAAVAAYVADVQAVRLSKGFEGEPTFADAECARAKLLQELPQVLGQPVGYKAAFTNPVLQQRFGFSGPAWGGMFAKMMVESGTRVPAQFGARPFFEADLIAVVKDAELADAKTPMEALDHIAELRAFIELPDLMMAGARQGPVLVATNVAFRGGVVGPRIEVERSQAFLDSLAAMTVVVTEDNSGQELGRAKGSVLMEHPINAVLWLAQALKQDGVTLKPGDFLSLGAFLPPVPPQPGTTISVRYLGLGGDPGVTVHFE